MGSGAYSGMPAEEGVEVEATICFADMVAELSVMAMMLLLLLEATIALLLPAAVPAAVFSRLVLGAPSSSSRPRFLPLLAALLLSSAASVTVPCVASTGGALLFTISTVTL